MVAEPIPQLRPSVCAIQEFFEDLRLSPRSKKTYRIALDKFVVHLRKRFGLDADRGAGHRSV